MGAPVKRARIRPISKKRAAALPDYETARQAAFDRDGHRCQAERLWPEIACAGIVEPHHLVPRGAWTAGLAVLANLKCLCSAHHYAVHHISPKRARELGLLLSSWQRPA